MSGSKTWLGMAVIVALAVLALYYAQMPPEETGVDTQDTNQNGTEQADASDGSTEHTDATDTVKGTHVGNPPASGDGDKGDGFFPGYQPFPAGYGYLQEETVLQAAIAAGNRVPLREHGWKIFAGINQPAAGLDWPVWYTWPNTSLAFFDAGRVYDKCTNPKPSEHLLGGAKSLQTGIRAHNTANVIKDDVPLPTYPIPQPVIDAYPDAVYQLKSGCNIKDGRHFQFNGDIMIPTESLSIEAFNWIHPSNPADPAKQDLYLKTTLNNLHSAGVRDLDAPKQHIVTKHMFWPVPQGGMGVLPVWNDDYPATFTGYAGYEVWDELVAINPASASQIATIDVRYLYGVDFSALPPERRPTLPIEQKSARSFGINNFYHHQVTEADWATFDDADKAILNAASYWAYNKPFGPGDFLVMVAMHVNTKEVPTWSLQSAWWSNNPYTGPYAANRPVLPQAQGPWQHYKLVTSYSIDPGVGNDMPVEMNPYIELVIHPVATNCQNCHNRAGWPTGSVAGTASYQNPDCPNLLGYLTPQSACFANIMLTDFQWIIPDRAY